jgi:4-amino-4-deoxy-L-arabinose transferase-like glycosyltransferase
MIGSTASAGFSDGGRSGLAGWVLRILRGSATTAKWERPALLGLLALTALLYLWDLSVSGWANSFYSAAVQAGASNWEAFFYGSSDAANSITVDKPPASLWLMELSVRAFGLSPASILLPEALIGVASVGVVFATVRRSFSAPTALLAGGVLALTPVAALMFRFNNPDALLVLLLSLSVYLTLRGIQSGKLRWVLWAGAMVGLGFLTKQLQAFVILPALAGIYLVAAPGTWWLRIRHLLLALAAVIVSAGWWVAIVELVPASMRPYVGGSQNNNFLELTFGYNGFGRLTGSETSGATGGGAVVGGTAAGTAAQWGTPGLLRLFEDEIGGQISWLLPAALILALVAFIVMRGGRGDLRRATLMLFVAWLLVTGLTFSFADGIFHAYYTVALAPAIAGIAAMGASVLWSHRAASWSWIIAAAAILATVFWGFAMLSETETWLPWLKWVALGLGFVAAVLLLLPQRNKRMTATTIAITLVAGLVAPAAYTIDTVLTGHTGSIVTAGPPVIGSGGGGAGGGRGTGGGAAGGGYGTGSVGPVLAAQLGANAANYTWVAATVTSDAAAEYQLATRDPVMPVGGFDGTDPSPTLSAFKADVAAGKIHYFIGGSDGQGKGSVSASSSIARWVEANFTATTVDGVTLYDLTAAK